MSAPMKTNIEWTEKLQTPQKTIDIKKQLQNSNFKDSHWKEQLQITDYFVNEMFFRAKLCYSQ